LLRGPSELWIWCGAIALASFLLVYARSAGWKTVIGCVLVLSAFIGSQYGFSVNQRLRSSATKP
jgi:hypothetical protein